jgi:hypothetical protein
VRRSGWREETKHVIASTRFVSSLSPVARSHPWPTASLSRPHSPRSTCPRPLRSRFLSRLWRPTPERSLRERSILFIILYALLVPLFVFRVARSASRSKVLIRPCIFVVVRILSFILRAYQANGHYSQGVSIAEQVLFLAGFLVRPSSDSVALCTVY